MTNENIPGRLRVLAELLWDREDAKLLNDAADELESLYARPVGLRFTLPKEEDHA